MDFKIGLEIWGNVRRVVKGTLCSNELELSSECDFRSCFNNGVKPCNCGVHMEETLRREVNRNLRDER